MQRNILGTTSLHVPVFALGTAPLATVTPEQAYSLLVRAVTLGATWWDTSEDYGNAAVIARGMANIPRVALTISSKTNALSAFEGHASVRQTLRAFDTGYLDIMFLHCVQDDFDLVRRQGCLEALCAAKERGWVRAVGLSSHTACVIEAAARMDAIDVVMAPWNEQGLLPGGESPLAMAQAINHCFRAGKGVVLMKLLANGELVPTLDAALQAGMACTWKHAICLGVRTIDELEMDIRLVNRDEAIERRAFEQRLRWDEAA